MYIEQYSTTKYELKPYSYKTVYRKTVYFRKLKQKKKKRFENWASVSTLCPAHFHIFAAKS